VKIGVNVRATAAAAAILLCKKVTRVGRRWWTVESEKRVFLQYSVYRPFKVMQGRWFWYQSKARMQLPISHW